MPTRTATARISCCAPRISIACIEAWPSAVFEALAEPLNRLDLFSQDHDDLAASLYADAFPVEADKEGRIVLPDSLVSLCRT